MALKRKRTNSPVGMKSQIYSQLQSNVHFLSPSSGTSWSSISSAVSSSTDTISVDEPNTPQNDSPTLNVRNNTRLRKAVFDRYGTTSTASTSSIAMSVDSWRMEVDDQGNDGHDAHTSTASSGFESHSMMETEVEVGLEVDENPSGRTRKRLRDNRPDETVIHENTLRKLFDAQRNPSQPYAGLQHHHHHHQTNNFQHQASFASASASTSTSTPPLLSFSSSSTIPSSSSYSTASASPAPTPPPSSSSTLDAFLGIATGQRNAPSNSDKKHIFHHHHHHHNRPAVQRLQPYNSPIPSAPTFSSFPSFPTTFHPSLTAPSEPHAHTMRCEDCDSTLSSDTLVDATGRVGSSAASSAASTAKSTVASTAGMMDIDSIMDEDSLRLEFACLDCGRAVCDGCACVLRYRRCLGCATGG